MRRLFGVFFLVCCANDCALTPIWCQTDFPPEEFKARWEKLFERTGQDAVALIAGVSLTNGYMLPRQTNDFYYPCGIETPGSYLLFDGRKSKAILYLPPRNIRLERAEGKVLSAEDADLVQRFTGVDEVHSTDAMFGDWLGRLPGGVPRTIYTPFSPAEGNAQSRDEVVAANAAIAADYWDGRLSREAQLRELLRARYPRSNVMDLTPIIDEMRSIKSPREISLIRRASQLAGFGMMEASEARGQGYANIISMPPRAMFSSSTVQGSRDIVPSVPPARPISSTCITTAISMSCEPGSVDCSTISFSGTLPWRR